MCLDLVSRAFYKRLIDLDIYSYGDRKVSEKVVCGLLLFFMFFYREVVSCQGCTVQLKKK